MFTHFVRVGIPKVAFTYIVRWLDRQLMEFDNRPTESDGYYWTSCGLGNKKHKTVVHYHDQGGVPRTTMDLKSFVQKCGYKSLRCRAMLSMSLGFKAKVGKVNANSEYSSRKGSLSMKIHDLVVMGYGKWSGPVQMLGVGLDEPQLPLDKKPERPEWLVPADTVKTFMGSHFDDEGDFGEGLDDGGNGDDGIDHDDFLEALLADSDGE